MNCVRFMIPGKPVGKARPRIGANGAVYTPNNTKKYEKMVGVLYREAKGPYFEKGVPLVVEILANYPKSKNNNKKIYPTGKPDLDNVAKIILDGLNGVAWHDDAQVVGLYVEKYYASDPHVLVQVREVGVDEKKES